MIVHPVVNEVVSVAGNLSQQVLIVANNMSRKCGFASRINYVCKLL